MLITCRNLPEACIQGFLTPKIVEPQGHEEGQFKAPISMLGDWGLLIPSKTLFDIIFPAHSQEMSQYTAT